MSVQGIKEHIHLFLTLNMTLYILGFGQGVRRSVESLAAIMGPLWAGAAFEFSTSYYPFYGVQIGVLLMVMVSMDRWMDGWIDGWLDG